MELLLLGVDPKRRWPRDGQRWPSVGAMPTAPSGPVALRHSAGTAALPEPVRSSGLRGPPGGSCLSVGSHWSGWLSGRRRFS